jgi:hypothetical protein
MLFPLVDAFLKEGLYLRDWTVCTYGSYRQALTAEGE